MQNRHQARLMDNTSLGAAITTDLINLKQHGVFCDRAGCRTCAYAALGLFIRTMGRWEAFLEEAIVNEMYSRTEDHPGRRPHGRFHISNKEEALQRLRGTHYDPETGVVTENATARGYILLHEPAMIRAVADYWVESSTVSAVVSDKEREIESIVYLRHAGAARNGSRSGTATEGD